MPIRIKPVYDLGPCALDLESIKGICSLVEQDFNDVKYSAEDNVWEIYNEGKAEFLSAISTHKTLDKFTVVARNRIKDPSRGPNYFSEKVLEVTFDHYQATLMLSAPYEHTNWFEHFIIDFKKNIRPPQFRQYFIGVPRKNNNKRLARHDILRDAGSFLGLVGTGFAGISQSEMASIGPSYCRIILHQKPPSPVVQGIAINLISNIIWVPIVFIAGITFAVIAYLVYTKYGINLNEWLTPPNIPTATPLP